MKRLINILIVFLVMLSSTTVFAEEVKPPYISDTEYESGYLDGSGQIGEGSSPNQFVYDDDLGSG